MTHPARYLDDPPKTERALSCEMLDELRKLLVEMQKIRELLEKIVQEKKG